jgi:oligopeptide/dipeptide ABC transporter ATP-binding protein
MQVVGLKKYFYESTGSLLDYLKRKKTVLKAVDGVDLKVNKEESLGIVGESGCGKSTLGRTILRLYEPTEGRIVFQGKDITHLGKEDLRHYRKSMQLVLQNPYSSLNPRKRVKQILKEVMEYHGFDDCERRAKDVLINVGLKPEHGERYPHELSGGQRQRVAIARAISIEPEFIVLDEVTSSLDVSVQAQIINLLLDLKRKFGLSYLFISHDLAVVKHICDRVAVMYLGKIVESGSIDSIFVDTLHPYAQALVSSIPSPEMTKEWKPTLLPGELQPTIGIPSGCRFHPRCPYAFDRCMGEEPELSDRSTAHLVACHLYDTKNAGLIRTKLEKAQSSARIKS